MYEHALHDFKTHGININGDISVDVNKMIANKNKAVKGLTGGIEMLFKKYKVQCSIVAICYVLCLARWTM